MEELIKLISDMNYELYLKHGSLDYYYSVSTTGDVEIIEFGGITLWSDQDDERKFNRKTGEYEDMEKFLKKKLRTVGKLLQQYSK